MAGSKSFSKNRNGFTLLEVVIFIVLAGILLPIIIAPFVTSIKNSEIPEVVLTANFLATQKYEALMGAGYLSLPTSIQVETITLNYPTYTQTYTRTTGIPVEVSAVDLSTPQASTGYKLVTITVTHSQHLPSGLAITGLITNRL
jgi:type II secretory pathway pseudopilin PulG